MQSKKMKFAFIMTGHSAYSEKMSDYKLVTDTVKALAKRLHMRGGICPGGIKLPHPDPKKTFVKVGVASYSLTVTLTTFPGSQAMELRVFSTRGLKGFQKFAEKVVREAFDLSGYEMDIHKLEKLR